MSPTMNTIRALKRTRYFNAHHDERGSDDRKHDRERKEQTIPTTGSDSIPGNQGWPSHPEKEPHVMNQRNVPDLGVSQHPANRRDHGTDQHDELDKGVWRYAKETIRDGERGTE